MLQFYLSSSDIDQFEAAQSEDEQRAILARLGASLPVLCRTSAGGRRQAAFIPDISFLRS